MATFRKRSGSWQVRVQRVNQPDVSNTFKSKQDAEAWARKIEAGIDQGITLGLVKAGKVKFHELLTRYRENVTPNKKGAAVETFRINRMLRDEPICNYYSQQITGKTLAEYRDARLKKVSSTSVRLELALFSAVYNKAIREWGMHLSNPVTNISLPRPNKARARRLSDDELNKFVASLDATARLANGKYPKKLTRNIWIGPLVKLAIETAMRQGEMLSLEWKNIDLLQGCVRLEDTKNGESRNVPLTKAAIAILIDLPKVGGQEVFPLTSTAVKQCFRRAVERAGINDFHFHDLRHEATSRLANKLSNVLELSAVTGHKDLRMLNRYYHPRIADLVSKLD